MNRKDKKRLKIVLGALVFVAILCVAALAVYRYELKVQEQNVLERFAHGDRRQQLEALDICVAFDIPAAKPYVVTFLHDPDPLVRCDAITIIGFYFPADAPLLDPLLQDPDPGVREKAAHWIQSASHRKSKS